MDKQSVTPLPPYAYGGKVDSCMNGDVYILSAFDLMTPHLRRLTSERNQDFVPIPFEDLELFEKMFHAERYTDIEDFYLVYLGIFRDVDDVDLTP